MANEELDRLIAEKVMGWVESEGAGYHSFQPWWRGDPERRTLRDWRPSTDANCMMSIIQKMVGLGFEPDITIRKDGCVCGFLANSPRIEAKTMMEAVCLSALKAVEGMIHKCDTSSSSPASL